MVMESCGHSYDSAVLEPVGYVQPGERNTPDYIPGSVHPSFLKIGEVGDHKKRPFWRDIE